MVEIFPWQGDMWQHWVNLKARNPHALLLKGPQGTGKLEFALRLAESLLCGKTMFCGLGCGECDSCHWFEQGSHPDFRLLQPEILSKRVEEKKEGDKKPSKYIVVEQIRELADFLNMSSHQGGYRVVVVHPAETMNPNAANALLKSLEEPRDRTLFILVSDKPQRLMPTIRSRCIVLSATLPPVAKSEEWLRQQGVAEPEHLLSMAGFAPLLALQLANDGGEAKEYGAFLDALARPAGFDALELAERMQKVEVVKFVHWMQQWCYDLASAKFAGTVRYYPGQAEALRKLAGQADTFGLLQYQRELQAARRAASHPLSPRLQFESLLLSYRQVLQA